MNTIFKVGDKVYHYIYGWGEVIEIDCQSEYKVLVLFKRLKISFTEDGKSSVKISSF